MEVYPRYYWLMLAESHLTRRLFAVIVGRAAALPVPAGKRDRLWQPRNRSSARPGTQRCLKKHCQKPWQRVLRTPQRQLGAAGTIRPRNRKWKGSLGDEWVYIRGRWKAKMDIPAGG